MLRLRLIAGILLCALIGTLHAEAKWERVSSIMLNWGDHPCVQVILEIPFGWSDPGDFTRIRIRVPGQKEFVLQNKLGWVKYSSDVAEIDPKLRDAPKLVKSRFVLGLNATKDGRMVLFLLGYSYASSPGSLDVIELSPSGQPRVVLHREELGLVAFRDLDNDGIAEIVGRPCLSQEFGNGLVTYDPIHIYKLGSEPGTQVELSLPLSKSYNLEHYYGWVGPNCSENFAVVLHPPHGGRPFVTTTKKAEQLGQPAR